MKQSTSASNSASLADEEFRSSLRNRLTSHDSSPSYAPSSLLRGDRFGARNDEDDGEERFVDQPQDKDAMPASRVPKLQPPSADGGGEHTTYETAGPLFELLLLQRHYAPSVSLLAARELAAPAESKSSTSEPV